ncbi:MAG: VWA domain-containing protein [Anaerolineae bacterium]|nr:VWA domain-containing protein [Anaerolineae bacterium]
MDLLWPGILLLLGLIPLLIVVYLWALRRRKVAVRYSSLALVRAALPRFSRVRRHLPFGLFLTALASLIIAFGRPVAVVAVPTNQTTIILAIDVSGSMCSGDIEPNRLQAAEAAAVSFIRSQKASTHIGVVAFSGFAEVIQPPTTDQRALESAIDSLLTGRWTAIGSAVLKSIDAISEIDENVWPSVGPDSSPVQPDPVPAGAYAPSIIVLLTDGASNAGPEPLIAAQQAVDRGVRVYTIGFGTAFGAEFVGCSPRFQGNEPFGGGPGFGGGPPGGGGGGRFRRGIDEVTLQRIADMTGGTYYSAESGSELQSVFQNLPTNIILKHEVTEISVIFTAIGAVLAGFGIALSMLWHPLP